MKTLEALETLVKQGYSLLESEKWNLLKSADLSFLTATQIANYTGLKRAEVARRCETRSRELDFNWHTFDQYYVLRYYWEEANKVDWDTLFYLKENGNEDRAISIILGIPLEELR